MLQLLLVARYACSRASGTSSIFHLQILGKDSYSECAVSMLCNVYRTCTRVHAQGLAAANFTITAYVGKLAPLGTEVLGKTSINATMVPYAGRMRPHHAYAGSVASRAWIYFRLTLGPSDVNANTPATVITVRHARPMEALSLYLRHDEAPLDFQVLEYLKLDILDILVPANLSKFGDGRGGVVPRQRRGQQSCSRAARQLQHSCNTAATELRATSALPHILSPPPPRSLRHHHAPSDLQALDFQIFQDLNLDILVPANLSKFGRLCSTCGASRLPSTLQHSCNTAATQLLHSCRLPSTL